MTVAVDPDALAAAYREGLEDTAAAARLGLSLRTLVRRVQEQMADMGAATRFQWGYRLGYAAGRREAISELRDAMTRSG